jgi:hypothetical protein
MEPASATDGTAKIENSPIITWANVLEDIKLIKLLV